MHRYILDSFFILDPYQSHDTITVFYLIITYKSISITILPAIVRSNKLPEAKGVDLLCFLVDLLENGTSIFGVVFGHQALSFIHFHRMCLVALLCMLCHFGMALQNRLVSWMHFVVVVVVAA